MIGKRLVLCFILLMSSGAVLAQDSNADESNQDLANAKPIKLDPDTISYAVGYLYGSQLRSLDVPFNLNRVTVGLSDAVNAVDPALSKKKMQMALQKMRAKLRRQQMRRFKKLAAKNLKQSKAFLAKKAELEGVQSLPSGLLYRVIREGEGEIPSAEDTVVVHYRTSLPSGLEFDSSYARGQPVTFQVNSVIEAWQQALTMMHEGAKWHLFVPPELAYGKRGKRPIGPNQALVFTLELVKIKEGGK